MVNLRALKSGMVGCPIGIEGRVYDKWDKDVLLGVSSSDAKQLLEFPGGWARVKAPAKKPPPKPAGDGGPTTTVAEEGGGPPPPSPPPQGPTPPPADPQGTVESEEEYTPADLRKMVKAQLLEFLDEHERPEAATLTKDLLIARILEGV